MDISVLTLCQTGRAVAPPAVCPVSRDLLVSVKSESDTCSHARTQASTLACAEMHVYTYALQRIIIRYKTNLFQRRYLVIVTMVTVLLLRPLLCTFAGQVGQAISAVKNERRFRRRNNDSIISDQLDSGHLVPVRDLNPSICTSCFRVVGVHISTRIRPTSGQDGCVNILQITL